MTETFGDQPLISIGMTVRNNERTIAAAVESILWQTCPQWELIVIDDGSTDNTLNILRGFDDRRIHVWSDGAWRGRPIRRNQTIEFSRGFYYACLDGDDVAYPRRLERQLDYLRQHPGVDLVGSGMAVFGADGAAIGKRVGPERHDAIAARPVGGIPMMHPTFLGLTDYFRRFGYRAAFPVAEDQDLLLRSYRHSTFANVPEILVGYRESTLSLKKNLPMRFYLATSVWGAFRDQHRWDLAARAVAEQGVKAMVDVAAIGSGLNYRILRHRATSMTPEERREWERLWTELNVSEPIA